MIGKLKRNSIVSKLDSGVEKHRLVCCLFILLSLLTSQFFSAHLIGGGELGHGLGALRHGVLGEFSGKEKSHGSLDLSGGQSGLLAVAGQTRSLKSQALEDIVDEGVQDGHASLGDASVGVNLLQHLVDVRSVGLDLLGLSTSGCFLRGLSSLLSDSGGLCHFDYWGWLYISIENMNRLVNSNRSVGRLSGKREPHPNSFQFFQFLR